MSDESAKERARVRPGGRAHTLAGEGIGHAAVLRARPAGAGAALSCCTRGARDGRKLGYCGHLLGRPSRWAHCMAVGWCPSDEWHRLQRRRWGELQPLVVWLHAGAAGRVTGSGRASARTMRTSCDKLRQMRPRRGAGAIRAPRCHTPHRSSCLYGGPRQ